MASNLSSTKGIGLKFATIRRTSPRRLRATPSSESGSLSTSLDHQRGCHTEARRLRVTRSWRVTGQPTNRLRCRCWRPRLDRGTVMEGRTFELAGGHAVDEAWIGRLGTWVCGSRSEHRRPGHCLPGVGVCRLRMRAAGGMRSPPFRFGAGSGESEPTQSP